MKRYDKKNRRGSMTYRELYKNECVKQRARIEKGVSQFGLNLVRGKYKARIILFTAAVLVLIGFGLSALYVTNLIDCMYWNLGLF